MLFANAPPASSKQVKPYAPEDGLNVAAFEPCFSSGTYQVAVRKKVEEGIRAGVIDTPGVFINGWLVSGAQPLEYFVQIIEDELARVR